MAYKRRPTTEVAKDTYGTPLAEGDKIVFSWSGSPYKAFIEKIRRAAMRWELIVIPLTFEDEPFVKDGERITAKVKSSLSTVKIS